MIKNLFKKFYFSENKISNKLRAFNYHKGSIKQFC